MTIATFISAELAVFLPALDKMLTALQAPGVNLETVVQDYAAEQLAAVQAVPQGETVGINQVAATAQTDLNKLVAPIVAPAPLAPPASSASGTAA